MYVDGVRPKGRPKKTWTEIMEKDCQACKLNREDAADRNHWLRTSSSTVLMATHHSYGRFCAFISARRLEVRPLNQLSCKMTNYANSVKNVPLGIKIETFVPRDPSP